MAFPPADPNRPKPPPKGKAKSRRYALAWVYREEPSNDETAWEWREVRSTNVLSAFTALLKIVNGEREVAKLKKDRLPVKKSGLVLCAAVDMQRTDKIEDFSQLEE